MKSDRRALLVGGIFAAVGLLSCNNSSGNDNGSATNQLVVPEGYKLVWADEFSVDGKPNPEYWGFEEGFVRNEEAQWYSPDNVFIEDGLLIFEARRERYSNPNYNPLSENWRFRREFIDYTSASIKTNGKFNFQYGILEVRARIDVRQGSWPAIWTLGEDRRWPLCGEIDVMEFYRVNDEPSILANAAWSVDQSWQPKWDSEVLPLQHFLEGNPSWAEEFHVWRMEWTEDHIRLYLDDELLNEIAVADTEHPEDGFHPFRQPHYILLNLAIGSNGGDPSATEFPLRYEVDYVRVFQKEQ